MPYFKFEGTDVYYKTKGQGKPLVLLHGNTASSRMFGTLLKSYSKRFRVILVDFPGHGKSGRLKRFNPDFWYYNSRMVHALINELKLDKVSIIGTSGGALVAINFGLEHPERIEFLFADSFEGAYPLPSYIQSIESDREKDKKKLPAKLFWFYCHGSDWKRIVDLDTKVNMKFAETGRSFFHKPISELQVPALLTGSREDEFCDHLDEIYGGLKQMNDMLQIHLFDKGNHPAMISNKHEFLDLVSARIDHSGKL